MCGFAGFVTYESAALGSDDRHRTLRAMGDAIAHRGPDDAQYYDDGRLALVFRRLSIIDLAGGRQPFFNERGDQLLVANGEVYNHHDLRRALEPAHSLRSRSDCEVLLHGIEQWGIEALQRVRGMFALAHWDLSTRRLTLARDRLGIKPLYVCPLPGGLLFGSELKALLAHPECPRSIAWGDVDRELVLQPPQASYVRGVELLPGGHWLEVDTQHRQVRSASYWKLEDHLGAAPFGEDAERYTQAYAELLEETVEQHLQRDVGAGLHLSGGVDSSLLAAVCAAKGAALPCFTVVERTSYLEGDVAAAQRLCERLGLPWVPLRFDHRCVSDDLCFDLSRLEEAVWMMDSPRFDLEWVFKAELHRAARARDPALKVVLLGQGADEFAGGYSRRLDAAHAGWADYLRDEVAPHWHLHEAQHGRASTTFSAMTASDRAGGPAAYHRFMLLLQGQLQHHNLWHEDRTSSWHSLEARVPFLDHRLVELLASVPASLHERLFWNKRIVRDALQRFAPGHALPQPKIGFLHGRDPASLENVLYQMLHRVAPTFRDKYLRTAGGPFDPDKLQALIDQALRRGPTGRSALHRALQCISLCIFERQLREPPTGRVAPQSAPVLPTMGLSDWQRWAAEMAVAPTCGFGWRPHHRVALRDAVEVLVPVSQSATRFHFLRDGEAAGQITLHDAGDWAASLIRHLAAGAGGDFTVQDWLDEFEIELPQLAALLDILFHQGVLRPGDDAPAIATPSGTASARASA
jgi:asparagine synthase (glutamine-hydrolysing)